MNFLNEDRDDYRSILSAEVCSVETAKTLGIFDATKYYASKYLPDLHTFSSTDPTDAKKKKALCSQRQDNTSVPNCQLVYPGLDKTADKCGLPPKQCPPSFVYDSRNNMCAKREILITPDRRKHCDSKPTDWYMIPNHYMGNGYSFEKTNDKPAAKPQNVCYAPCPKYHVKDVLKAHGTTKAKCVDKIDYLGGKYGMDSDFCNLAWIKRLSTTSLVDLEQSLVQQLPTYSRGSSSIETLAKADAKKIISDIMTYGYENVGPHTDDMDNKCKKKVDTDERLIEAHAVCKEIVDDPKKAEADYVARVAVMFQQIKGRKLTDVEEKDVINYFRTLKQACHFTFCDKADSSRAYDIKKPPLCFKMADIERIEVPETRPLAVALSASKEEVYGTKPYEAPFVMKIPNWKETLLNLSQTLLKLIGTGMIVLAFVLLFIDVFGFPSMKDLAREQQEINAMLAPSR